MDKYMSNFFYKCIFLLCLFAIGSGATALANNEEGGKDSEPKKIEITGEPLSKKDVKSYLKLADYLFDLGKYKECDQSMKFSYDKQALVQID